MNTLFTEEIFKNCIAPQSEIDEAIAHGKKISFNDENGVLTAFLWNEKVYIIEFDISPEAFETC